MHEVARRVALRPVSLARTPCAADSRHMADATPDPFVCALREQLGAASGGPVALHETHLSWVLLAGDGAWKLKRPVRLPFVDFSTPALRHAACLEELRLNRRLAPGLYLDVVPIHGDRAAPRWQGGGPVIDHAVHMRRFADDALLGARVAAGTLSRAQVDRLAARLAAFHRDAERCGAAGLVPPERTAADLAAQVLAADDPRTRALRRWLLDEAARLAPRFREREAGGAVRDGHGDLHLDNLVVVGDDVTAFDALEFDPGLRRIDIVADLAFATMDLGARGRPDLAARLLDGWLAGTGDFEGLRVMRFHEVCRALVRALVRRLSPAGGPAAAPDYLEVARGLARTADTPRLLLMHGLSGSGKSRLASALLERAGAVRVRSDVERKRLAGLAADASSRAAGLALYDAASTRRTYAALLDAARAALDGGRPVIVDATCLRRDQRDPFRDEARARAVPFAVLACEAPHALLRERVARRALEGRDASEADLAVLDAQCRDAEAFDADELADVWRIDTSGDVDVDVEAIARRWAAASRDAVA